MTNCKLILSLDPKKSSDPLLDNLKNYVLLNKFVGHISWIKIGFPAFHMLGNKFKQELQREIQNEETGESEIFQYKSFLDLKFYDIPNIVAENVRVLTSFGSDMISMHTLGGTKMMRVASEAAENAALQRDIQKPILLGVTILTSSEKGYFKSYFASNRSLTEQVTYLASQAQNAGLDGVVASAHEIEQIRKVCGNDFKIVVPGIRPKWAKVDLDDQNRFTTPKEAAQLGADYIVVGRPIFDSENPIEATKQILKELVI